MKNLVCVGFAALAMYLFSTVGCSTSQYKGVKQLPKHGNKNISALEEKCISPEGEKEQDTRLTYFNIRNIEYATNGLELMTTAAKDLLKFTSNEGKEQFLEKYSKQLQKYESFIDQSLQVQDSLSASCPLGNTEQNLQELKGFTKAVRTMTDTLRGRFSDEDISAEAKVNLFHNYRLLIANYRNVLSSAKRNLSELAETHGE